MPTAMPVMPVVFLLLLLLPIRLASVQLKALAFFLWLLGGVMLCWFGLSRLFQSGEEISATTLIMVSIVAMAIGIAKGKFVLSKTSQRNIERLDEITEPLRPIHVYSVRSWIVIGVMVLISLSLTWLNVPILWRGGVNLAIGFALIISSLAYLKSLQPLSPPAA